MARTVAAGSASLSVTVWCTNSLVIGAYFWLFLRIDSSAPHWARVMTGGSAALGFTFVVVVVVLDDTTEPLVVVVVDALVVVVVEDEAASEFREPPRSPPSPPFSAVVEVVLAEGSEVAVLEDGALTGSPVATRWRRGPLTVSMAMI